MTEPDLNRIPHIGIPTPVASCFPSGLQTGRNYQLQNSTHLAFWPLLEATSRLRHRAGSEHTWLEGDRREPDVPVSPWQGAPLGRQTVDSSVVFDSAVEETEKTNQMSTLPPQVLAGIQMHALTQLGL